jgi:hypothetical protein
VEPRPQQAGKGRGVHTLVGQLAVLGPGADKGLLVLPCLPLHALLSLLMCSQLYCCAVPCCCVCCALPQAVSRVWRYGQQRPCFIYHLMYAGTFETRVFERVLVKEELFQRVRHHRAHVLRVNPRFRGRPQVCWLQVTIILIKTHREDSCVDNGNAHSKTVEHIQCDRQEAELCVAR